MMTRPDDIPEDVWQAALKAAAEELEPNQDGFLATEAAIDTLVRASARAIMAEREACALKADRYTTAKFVRRCRELTTHEVYEVKIFARLIAHDIRKGS